MELKVLFKQKSTIDPSTGMWSEETSIDGLLDRDSSVMNYLALAGEVPSAGRSTRAAMSSGVDSTLYLMHSLSIPIQQSDRAPHMSD